MARSRNGQAVSPERRTAEAIKELRKFRSEAEQARDLAAWRRAHGVLRYVEGTPAAEIAEGLGVERSSVNRWLIWYNKGGCDGLLTQKHPGSEPRLLPDQRQRLMEMLEAGPQAAGFTTGLWTGPMVGDLIQREFGVTYHEKHVPRLLRKIGFSVQRPRKRLARADPEAQRMWKEERLPAIKKKPKK